MIEPMDKYVSSELNPLYNQFLVARLYASEFFSGGPSLRRYCHGRPSIQPWPWWTMAPISEDWGPLLAQAVPSTARIG